MLDVGSWVQGQSKLAIKSAPAPGRDHRVVTDRTDSRGKGGDSLSFAAVTPPAGVHQPPFRSILFQFGSTAQQACARGKRHFQFFESKKVTISIQKGLNKG